MDEYNRKYKGQVEINNLVDDAIDNIEKTEELRPNLGASTSNVIKHL